MPMTWTPSSADRDTIPMIQAVFADKEKKRRSSAPVRHTATPFAHAQAIYKLIEDGGFSAMRVVQLTGILAENPDTSELPVDAGQDPVGQTLNFNLYLGSDTFPTLQKLYVPAALIDDPAEWNALGESVATQLEGDSNVSRCNFVPVNYR